jgi:hypothetical protein
VTSSPKWSTGRKSRVLWWIQTVWNYEAGQFGCVVEPINYSVSWSCLTKLLLALQNYPTWALNTKMWELMPYIHLAMPCGCRSMVGRRNQTNRKTWIQGDTHWDGACKMCGLTSAPWNEVILSSVVGWMEWSVRPAATSFINSQKFCRLNWWIGRELDGKERETLSTQFLNVFVPALDSGKTEQQPASLVCLRCWLISEFMCWAGSWSSWTFIIFGLLAQWKWN